MNTIVLVSLALKTTSNLTVLKTKWVENKYIIHVLLLDFYFIFEELKLIKMKILNKMG